MEAVRARLEETITQVQAKNAEITRLVDQREAAAKGYYIPQKFSLAEYLESKSKPEAGEEENDFEDDCEAEAGDWLQRATKKGQSKSQSKQKVKLHKKQGATPPSRQSPVSGGSRSRDQVEPTGETPTQPKARSRNAET